VRRCGPTWASHAGWKSGAELDNAAAMSEAIEPGGILASETDGQSPKARLVVTTAEARLQSRAIRWLLVLCPVNSRAIVTP
jgi:hypothetical protein